MIERCNDVVRALHIGDDSLAGCLAACNKRGCLQVGFLPLDGSMSLGKCVLEVVGKGEAGSLNYGDDNDDWLYFYPSDSSCGGN